MRHQATPAAPLATREIGHDGAALERPFVNLFREAQPTPPGEIILDLDATDDPLPGIRKSALAWL